MMEEGGVNKVDDMGDGASMICSKHPFKNNSNNNPGGICAFCLQDKLGKLVSSSFPMTIFPSSSSSSPSSRSESFNVLAAAAASSGTHNKSKVTTLSSSSSSSIAHFHSATKDSNFQNHYPPRRTRFPFLSTQRRRKKKEQQQLMMGMGASLKRSKSTCTPRNDFLHGVENEDYTPHRRKFWSFFYLSSKPLNTPRRSAIINQTNSHEEAVQSKVKGKDLIEEEVISARNPTNATPFERKVSRSRSVGCGSRSFSGDFFERISTGLGDCTLRRVESQREGKPKVASAASTTVHSGENHHCIKERVRCGGIFGGFIMTSSSSSSSSSIQWVPPNTEDAAAGPVVTRSRNWAWAFASPMRAFTKSSSRSSNNTASKTITAPNLASMPSLLASKNLSSQS